MSKYIINKVDIINNEWVSDELIKIHDINPYNKKTNMVKSLTYKI